MKSNCAETFLLVVFAVALACGETNTYAQSLELVKNPGFELGDSSWEVVNKNGDASVKLVSDVHHAGGWSAQIHGDSPVSAGWSQSFKLLPNTMYRLTAWVKTQSVSRDGVGAFIGQESDTYCGSKNLHGDNDWTLLSFTAYTHYNGELKISCRLGSPFKPSSGTVWFDEVSLSPVPNVYLNAWLFKDTNRLGELTSADKDAFAIVQGHHIVLRVRAKKLAILNDPLAWVRNLDAVYAAYADLVGFSPYDGKPIIIQEVEANPGAWARSGNPITWGGDYIAGSFKEVNQGNWLFGIMHEMGHDFDKPAWNWHSEQWANFKMLYAMEKSHATVFGGGTTIDYAETNSLKLEDITYKETAAKRDEDVRLNPDLDCEDCETYHLALLKNKIGWEPFKRTFRVLQRLSDQTSLTREEKIRRFAYCISQQSGQNLLPWFAEHGFPIGADAAKSSPPPGTSPAALEHDAQAELSDLKKRFDQGTISKEVYDQKRKAILDSL